jgi:hypothetical protein
MRDSMSVRQQDIVYENQPWNGLLLVAVGILLI